MTTAAEILTDAVKSIDQLKQIRILLAHAANITYEQIALSPNTVIDGSALARFHQFLERYYAKEPISKIVNSRSFWKYDFYVNEHVLDPRQDTETLVDAVLTHYNVKTPLKVLDIGTGSGCILLTLLAEYPHSQGIGIDISPDAIQVALINQKRLNIANAKFYNVGWMDFQPQSKFDVIVSNPPYIKTTDIQTLDKAVRDYDPYIALDGGVSGLCAYEEIIPLAKQWLSPHGRLYLEVGYNQAYDVSALLSQHGYNDIHYAKDLSDVERIVSGRLS